MVICRSLAFSGDRDDIRPDCDLRLVRPPVDRRRAGDFARYLPALRTIVGAELEDQPGIQRSVVRGVWRAGRARAGAEGRSGKALVPLSPQLNDDAGVNVDAGARLAAGTRRSRIRRAGSDRSLPVGARSRFAC